MRKMGSLPCSRVLSRWALGNARLGLSCFRMPLMTCASTLVPKHGSHGRCFHHAERFPVVGHRHVFLSSPTPSPQQYLVRFPSSLSASSSVFLASISSLSSSSSAFPSSTSTYRNSVAKHTSPVSSPPLVSEPTLRWRPQPACSWTMYQELIKAKLSALVLLTTMAAYAIAPHSLDLVTLFYTTLGTGLCVASANSINQWVEAPYDAQMSRTKQRVLVRHALSAPHAFGFGLSCGLVGVTILTQFVNPFVGILGASNILLYTCVYTPMKRTSIANTWVGAIVGAIPPIMGWVACTGSLDYSAISLGLVLFAWQFPHFNALSWNLRSDYSKAGYRMMCVMDPALNARVALRYSLLLFPVSLAMPYLGVTTPLFLVSSTLLNGHMAWKAFQFWRNVNDSTARGLFFASLIHLPVYLILLMWHKKPADEVEVATFE